MISASELRIGNLVRYKFRPNGAIGSAIQLNDIELGYVEVEPFVITEEWLFKLGFKKDNVCFISANDKSDISYEYEIEGLPFYGRFILNLKSGVGYFEYHYCVGEFNCEEAVTREIKHVHDLQNLFHALTGKELTIQQPTSIT